MNIIRRLHNSVCAVKWNIGFIESPVMDILEGKQYKIYFLSHNYRDRWFADPWLLSEDEQEIKCLVEEKRMGAGQNGYISLLTIDRQTYRLKERRTILKLDSHLSFPATIEDNGKLYFYPENAAGEGLGMYLLEKNGQCVHVSNLSREGLADAVITDLFGERMMFATKLPNQNGDTLFVYRLGKDGEYILENEHHFESNIARNAGNWFKLGDQIYRPAQDCNGGYGKAVVLQKVSRGNDGRFMFHNIQRIISTDSKLCLGLHTFNHFGDLIVVDAYGYKHPLWLVKVSHSIISFLSGIKHIIK